MLMSEAVSDNKWYYSTPVPKQVLCTVAIAVLALVAWIGALVGIALDVAIDIPDTVPTGVAVFAATATVVAVQLGIDCAHQRRASVVLAAVVDRADEAGTAGEEMPPGVAVQIYDMGKRAGSRARLS